MGPNVSSHGLLSGFLKDLATVTRNHQLPFSLRPSFTAFAIGEEMTLSLPSGQSAGRHSP